MSHRLMCAPQLRMARATARSTQAFITAANWAAVIKLRTFSSRRLLLKGVARRKNRQLKQILDGLPAHDPAKQCHALPTGSGLRAAVTGDTKAGEPVARGGQAHRVQLHKENAICGPALARRWWRLRRCRGRERLYVLRRDKRRGLKGRRSLPRRRSRRSPGRSHGLRSGDRNGCCWRGRGADSAGARREEGLRRCVSARWRAGRRQRGRRDAKGKPRAACMQAAGHQCNAPC